MRSKLIIITAPSGSGKTTIVNRLLKQFPQICFCISACTRAKRSNEIDGAHYYFMSVEEFKNKIANHEFVEYEMVYEGKYYGTPKSEVERIWNLQQIPILDVDVHGAIRIIGKKEFDVLSIFIKAPSVGELEKRLRARGTESEQTLQERLQKAESELAFAQYFDHCVVNDNLEQTCNEVQQIITTFVV